MKTLAKIILISSAIILVACKKDDPPPPPVIPDEYENGLVILNEGLFQQNNASLCFYSFANNQIYTQSFFSENGRGLGDTANDFERYTLNGVEYIIVAVDISSQLEIINANTLKSVAQIPVFNGATAREPRRIEIYGTTAFVCNFDGTVSVVDLTTNTIISTLAVGANPDGMVKVGSKLFVSNSGGLNYPVYDSTVTVIDMNSKTVINTFETRINCSKMIVDSQNEIYLISAGNYGSINPALVKINATTESVISETEWPISTMTKVGDWIYYFDSALEHVRRYNMSTESFESGNLIDCSTYETFSGMQYIAELDLLFCFDAKGYVNSSVVKAYTTSGVFQYEFTAELNAKKLSYND